MNSIDESEKMGKKRNRRPYKTGSVYLRGSRFWIAYYFNGQQVREGGFESKSDAEKVLKMKQADIYRGKYKLPKQVKISFLEMVEKYFEWARVNKKSWKKEIPAFKHLTKYFKDYKLNEITNFSIESYKNERINSPKGHKYNKEGKKVCGTTVNRELSYLKRMFNLAIRWGLAEYNPVNGVKFFREEPKERILSPEEINLILKEANGHLKPIIIVALNTGMRMGEILSLKWKDVNFQSNFIQVEHTKNGKIRKIPMNKTVREILSNLPKLHPDCVFVNEATEKPMESLNTSFRMLKKRTGLKDIRFHDLRHTFATYSLHGGADLISLKDILGHSDIRMTSRYAHSSFESKKKAVDCFAQLISSREEKINHKLITIPLSTENQN